MTAHYMVAVALARQGVSLRLIAMCIGRTIPETVGLLSCPLKA